MELRIVDVDGRKVAKVVSQQVVISTVQDALDLMANADYRGARSIVVHEKNLDPSFFQLRTGLAGDILQKCSNYRVRIAIVGDFTTYDSASLNSFIVECNRGNSIFFTDDIESATRTLAGQAGA